MLRKQRKLQPWRKFEHVILIILKFGELFLWFSPRIIDGLRSYIKHSRGCFVRYPNTLKLVKKNSAAPRFFNHFSVFRYRMKHSSSCLIYYVSSHWISWGGETLGRGLIMDRFSRSGTYPSLSEHLWISTISGVSSNIFHLVFKFTKKYLLIPANTTMIF